MDNKCTGYTFVSFSILILKRLYPILCVTYLFAALSGVFSCITIRTLALIIDSMVSDLNITSMIISYIIYSALSSCTFSVAVFCQQMLLVRLNKVVIEELFQCTLRAKYKFFLIHCEGDITSAMQGITHSLSDILDFIFYAVSNIIIIIIATSFIMSSHIYLTCIVLCDIIFWISCMAISFRISAQYAAESSQSFMKLYRHISDVILNISRVHAAQKYQHESNLIKHRTAEYAEKEYRLTTISTGTYICQSTFNDILRVAGLLMTISLYSNNQISLSDFTQFHMLMGMIDHALSSIGGNIAFMINGVGTYRKFIDFLCTDLEA